ncbi:MAG: hypothetical protein MRY49_00265 [Candidatus Pacebacteria bacterium]|nr:hypothetical protein [Candidatus Paceibacterota bacterium]
MESNFVGISDELDLGMENFDCMQNKLRRLVKLLMGLLKNATVCQKESNILLVRTKDVRWVLYLEPRVKGYPSEMRVESISCFSEDNHSEIAMFVRDGADHFIHKNLLRLAYAKVSRDALVGALCQTFDGLEAKLQPFRDAAKVEL